MCMYRPPLWNVTGRENRLKRHSPSFCFYHQGPSIERTTDRPSWEFHTRLPSIGVCHFPGGGRENQATASIVHRFPLIQVLLVWVAKSTMVLSLLSPSNRKQTSTTLDQEERGSATVEEEEEELGKNGDICDNASPLSSTSCMKLRRRKPTAATSKKQTKRKKETMEKSAQTKTKSTTATKWTTAANETQTQETTTKESSLLSRLVVETKTEEDTSSSEESEQEEAACCLCHCGVDCSDRALFFKKDRKEELKEDDEYYFGMEDPYLEKTLYDRHNSLVYCDCCNRLYHQKCHFVPLLIVPRGDWICFICSLQQKSKKKLSKQEPWKPYADPKSTTDMFRSPPPPVVETRLAIQQLQQQWETATAGPKAKLWHQQLKQFKTFLSTQASNIRMATAALETLMFSKQNRVHFSSGQTSQELAQTLLRLCTGKRKIRDAFASLEGVRQSKCSAIHSRALLQWCRHYPQHAHHIFPYGSNVHETYQRTIPRTREMALEETETDHIPTEIVCAPSCSSPTAKQRIQPLPPAAAAASTSNDDEEDSGITLDDLQCCVCLVGDSTDENDVLLCDGQGCYRAFHMRCVEPKLTLKDVENEDEDWFCPLCSTISNLFWEVQILCVGEDHPNGDEMVEWEQVDDVFPGAEWEYETALKLKKGRQNEDTKKLLAMHLGDNNVSEQSSLPIGSDSEDEEDFSLFDQESFDKKRAMEGKGDTEDHSNESSRSSQATLLNYSDVEYNVGRNELAALSDEVSLSCDDDDECSDTKDNNRRSSRRLRSRMAAQSGESSQDNNGADFSEANILPGKRRRETVDYQRLNDAMFGGLSAKEKAQIDDKSDFKLKKKLKYSSLDSEDKSSRRSKESDSDGGVGDNGSKNDDSKSEVESDYYSGEDSEDESPDNETQSSEDCDSVNESDSVSGKEGDDSLKEQAKTKVNPKKGYNDLKKKKGKELSLNPMPVLRSLRNGRNSKADKK